MILLELIVKLREKANNRILLKVTLAYRKLQIKKTNIDFYFIVNSIPTRYFPNNSILHTARTLNKVLLALVFICASGTGGGLVLLTIAILCHLGMLISKISILDAWKRLVAMKTFLFILGGMSLLFTPGTRIQLFNEVVLPITIEGLQFGFFTVSRIALMIWVSMILVWTTSPKSLMEVVTKLGSRFFPGNKFFHEFFLIGILAFQTLPSLFYRAEKEIGKVWKEQSENKKQVNLLATLEEMVNSLMLWVVEILTESRQLADRQKKI